MYFHRTSGGEEEVKLENTRIEEQRTWIYARISELESAKTSNEEEQRLIEIRIDKQNLTMMTLQQEWKSECVQALERLTRSSEDGGCNPAAKIMKLQFRSKIPESILTGEEFSVEVALVDSTTNNIVETGQESSAKIEIVVLNGGVEDDLTDEAFKEKIVPGMEGKEPIVREYPQVKLQRDKAPLDKITLKLQKGKAFLDKLSFKHNRSNTKQRQIRLGVRIANQIFDGVRVKEAMTETFTVKDYRNKYNRKHKNPLLSDEVSRLINIGRSGKIVKNLKENKIETLEDFLIQLLINPEGLKNIVNLSQKTKWEAIVNNARACQKDRKMYCYVNHQRKMGVVFNVLREVLRLYLYNQSGTTAVLPGNHQDVAQELLSSAYIHWEDVRTFDDENAVKKYLTGISMTDPLKLDNPGEMIGESSSRSNFSFQGISSGMNWIAETGDDDMIRSFRIDNFNRPKRWRKLLHVFRVSSIRGKHFFGVSKRHYTPCLDDKILKMTETPKRWEKTVKHARTCTSSDTVKVSGKIQPEDGIISSHDHLEKFWNDPIYLPHGFW